MILMLTLLALFGAAASANNYRHARDHRSPERPAHARLYRALGLVFGSLVVWAGYQMLKGSYDMTAGRWVVYWLTFVAAAVAIVRSCINDAALTARRARYRVMFKATRLILLAPLLSLVVGCTAGTGGAVLTADPAYKQANRARYTAVRPWLDDYATLRPELAPRVRDTADAWKLEVTAQQNNPAAPATQPAK